jgi:uncharacterized protein YbjT (DUF2867 family)
MRLLVPGSTRFLGRAIVDDAISRGHDVTTFSRGLSGQPQPGAEALHGDRASSEDLLQLAERDWDAIIDTFTIAPRTATPAHGRPPAHGPARMAALPRMAAPPHGPRARLPPAHGCLPRTAASRARLPPAHGCPCTRGCPRAPTAPALSRLTNRERPR